LGKMQSENDLIKGCQEYNIKAQEALYKLYSRKMNAVCYNYIGNTEDAEDVLHEGFIKVFAKIGQYKGDGSFEGWIRRIMINSAIDFLKKEKHLHRIFSKLPNDDEVLNTPDSNENHDLNSYYSFTSEELVSVVNELPKDYRIIFNMYCVENYSHNEISNLLGIPENTSRSKLRRSREMLRGYLNKIIKNKSAQYEF